VSRLAKKRNAWAAIFVVITALTATACMEHSRCDDQLVKRVPSPDKSLQLAIYNRSCSRDTGRYTYATILKTSSSFWFKDDLLCYVATLHGYHPMEAAWKDSKHVQIRSTAPLRETEVSSKEETCGEIRIDYDLKIQPSLPQEAPNPRVLGLIRKTLEQSDRCLREKSGEAVRNSLHAMLEVGRDREVLEMLCHNLKLDSCEISRETYNDLKEAGLAMGIDAKYWEDLESQVR
jgi:hypothetical protein